MPPGRYRAHNGSSNFFISNNGGFSGGSNIILGGRFGVDEYIFTVRQGAVIETRAPVTLTPIQ